MTLSTQPYKGSRDFYPEDQKIQSWMFAELAKLVSRFGYLEYNGPMLEPFELYAAKTGEEIVNQQLYSFEDRGERKVALRPEMTPTLARMVAAKVQELAKPIRWYSIPNLWRYERPQKGRLREHWQLNVDVLGGDPLLADAEVLEVCLGVFSHFGGRDKVSIKVNNRRLMDHFFLEVLELNGAGAAALAKLVDARAKMDAEKFSEGAKNIGVKDLSRLEAFFRSDLSVLGKEMPCQGVEELTRLFACLGSEAQKSICFDSSVMRGMDYYTGTVFEAYDVSPENNRALCGGGRYDNLIGLFGKQQLSGMGFGLGDVTLRNFLETHALLPAPSPDIDVFITTPSEAELVVAQNLARQLRAAGLKVVLPLSFDGFGAQLKRAVKMNVRWAILLGADELKRQAVVIKDLKSGIQHERPIAGLESHLLTTLHP